MGDNMIKRQEKVKMTIQEVEVQKREGKQKLRILKEKSRSRKNFEDDLNLSDSSTDFTSKIQDLKSELEQKKTLLQNLENQKRMKAIAKSNQLQLKMKQAKET